MYVWVWVCLIGGVLAPAESKVALAFHNFVVVEITPHARRIDIFVVNLGIMWLIINRVVACFLGSLSMSGSLTKSLPKRGFVSLDVQSTCLLSASLGAKGFRDSPTVSARYIGA